MKSTLIATILILNIAFSNAVFLKKPTQAAFSLFSQLQEIEQHNFGKQILDTIALQLANKSPLQDIAKMLADIRVQLVTQQQDADSEHATMEQQCEETIFHLNEQIDQATVERDDSESQISILKGQIKQFEAEIRNKGVQLDILNSRDYELDVSRETDSAAFEARQRQSVEVVDALDLIIEKLSNIQPENNPLTVLAELNKIGATNPIMALVQVASTFSAESLNKVINKMSELQASINAAAADDKVNEQAAIQEYNLLKSEIVKTRKDVANEKAELETQKIQAEGALAIQEKRYEESVNKLLTAQTEKAETETRCEAARVKWAAEKESRTAEINVVKQVEAIIATKLDTMKDYLKDRANN